MTDDNKSCLIWAIIIIIAIGGYFGYNYYSNKKDGDSKKVQETKKDEQTLKKDAIKNDFAKKYDALTDWEKDQTYTLQLQNDIVAPNKPIVFTSNLNDVFKQGDKYFVRLENWSSSSPDIYFILECSQQKAEELISKSSDSSILSFLDEYVVIAKIDFVKKTLLQISGDNEDGDVVLSDSYSDSFVANGALIDIMPLKIADNK